MVLMRLVLVMLDIIRSPFHDLAFDVAHVVHTLMEIPPLLGGPFELIEVLFFGAGDGQGRHATLLQEGDLVALLLLALALLVLHGAHAFGVLLAVEGGDVQLGQVPGQELPEQGQHLGVGPVGPAVVVDEQLVVGGFGGDLGQDVFVGVDHGDLGVVRGPLAMAMLATTEEELAGVGNVDGHVAVHGVFAQQIDAELLACFREA